MRKYILLIATLIIGCVWGYGLVFWGNIIFSSDIRFGTTLWKQVILDDTNLSKNIIVYQSNTNLSSYEVFSICVTDSRFLDSAQWLYFFEILYSSENCKSESIVLKKGDTIYADTTENIKITTKTDILAKYIDYDTNSLLVIQKQYQKILSINAIYKNYTGTDIIKYLKYALGNRQYGEAKINYDIITEVITGRDKKYISPVSWATLSTQSSKIPNSGRPYRASYTDWIHHGWDIDTNFRDPVIALDDGIIVRIVDGFQNSSDFSKIVYSPNLDENQKLKNLDILRGNQVWLKTMKGDVVFYSHLNSIEEGISEGARVSRWDLLWKIGVTGVPEVGYDDYHLHFAVMKNPYIKGREWLYDFWDYMAWDWYARWLSQSETIEVQNTIFE